MRRVMPPVFFLNMLCNNTICMQLHKSVCLQFSISIKEKLTTLAPLDSIGICSTAASAMQRRNKLCG